MGIVSSITRAISGSSRQKKSKGGFSFGGGLSLPKIGGSKGGSFGGVNLGSVSSTASPISGLLGGGGGSGSILDPIIKEIKKMSSGVLDVFDDTEDLFSTAGQSIELIQRGITDTSRTVSSFISEAQEIGSVIGKNIITITEDAAEFSATIWDSAMEGYEWIVDAYEWIVDNWELLVVILVVIVIIVALVWMTRINLHVDVAV